MGLAREARSEPALDVVDLAAGREGGRDGEEPLTADPVPDGGELLDGAGDGYPRAYAPAGAAAPGNLTSSTGMNRMASATSELTSSSTAPSSSCGSMRPTRSWTSRPPGESHPTKSAWRRRSS